MRAIFDGITYLRFEKGKAIVGLSNGTAYLLRGVRVDRMSLSIGEDGFRHGLTEDRFAASRPPRATLETTLEAASVERINARDMATTDLADNQELPATTARRATVTRTR